MGVKIVSSSGVLCARRIQPPLNAIGMRELRYATAAQSTSELACTALRAARFSNYKNVNTVIVATSSAEGISPATSHRVIHRLNLSESVSGFDVASSCTSFLSATRTVAGCLSTDNAVALVAAEFKHPVVESAEPNLKAIFSDGASASILHHASCQDSSLAICYQKTRTDLFENIKVTEGPKGPLLVLKEPKTMYRTIIDEMEQAIVSLWSKRNALMESRGCADASTAGYVFIHQANPQILFELRRRLPFDISRRVPILMSDIGNSVSASIGILRARVLLLECMKSGAAVTAEVNADGLLHSCERQGEKISVLDCSTLDPKDSWMGLTDTIELETINRAVETELNSSSKISVDLWVAAGGGFQTLGLLHSRKRVSYSKSSASS